MKSAADDNAGNKFELNVTESSNPSLPGWCEELPRSKQPRTIRLVRSPRLDGVGAFFIQDRRSAVHYVMVEIPCEIGGRGFVVHRMGLGNVYHVRVGDPEDCSCECLGFLRHGYCRHVLGLLALIRHEKL